MKAIHKITKKNNLRPVFNYIRVKNGFLTATNGYAAIKMPIDEVFPLDLVSKEDEIYFDATQWAASKMDKAVTVERDGLTFKIFDKKGITVGIIVALNVESFERNVGRFPDVDAVFPKDKESKDISTIAFNPALLLDLCTAFGCDIAGFNYSFYGTDKCITVSHLESKALGIILPLYRGA